MEGIEAFLGKNPYFDSLSRAEVRELARLLVERHYERGEYLFMEGDAASWAGIILEGRVKLVKHSDTGKDLTLDVLGPGRLVGLTTLSVESVCRVSAQAMEPTRILSLARNDWAALLERHPRASLAVISDLGRRLEEAYEMMRSLALERVERRVALNLIKLAGRIGVARPQDGSVLIDLPLTRQDVAEMSGTTLETAIRTMSKFQKQGLVESEDGRIRLLKPHQLVLIAEDVAGGLREE